MDEETDICVLEFDVDGPVQHLPLAQSSILRSGEWVVVIGSPLSLMNSVCLRYFMLGFVELRLSLGQCRGRQQHKPGRERDWRGFA